MEISLNGFRQKIHTIVCGFIEHYFRWMRVIASFFSAKFYDDVGLHVLRCPVDILGTIVKF